MPRPPDAATLADLRAAVGNTGYHEAPADVAPYVEDFRRLYHGSTPIVLLPANVAQVARILAICDRDEVAVVPQGGNTGYCGAATPDGSGAQVVIAMRRLNRIREIDAVNDSMILEAGCTLAAAQDAARAAVRLFPLSLGSEGSAQIGGNLSTNAGGTAVLRYGMMRDLTLGLEVVLADGRVLSALKKLRKDNTGYDVKSLFIGAEGTLGVITAAALKLFALPAESATALVGVASASAALELLVLLRGAFGEEISSFELMPRRAVELTVRHVDGVADPLAENAPWFVLVEIGTTRAGTDPSARLADQLASAADLGLVSSALLAASLAQGQAIWKLRESVPEAQTRHGASLKHDLSVPVSAVPRLIELGTALIERLVPQGETIAYGHLGDGNLHFNVSLRPGADRTAFLARREKLQEAMFDLTESLGGSFSAEHGIGRLKAGELARRANPVELALMRDLKRALDPKGILNPGKVLA
ncbi:MAG TPA: FAD-binding oxidoreductase [Steroidobacteraceae bacterium]|nr:FAD-binding oxidoreductase [Steroidobacteraceae bacterium]